MDRGKLQDHSITLEQQIAMEEKKYAQALKDDAPFFILKEIRLKIKNLKIAAGNNYCSN